MKRSIPLLFFIVFCSASYAQTVPENSGQIKVYDSYQPASSNFVMRKNKLSINPLGVLIGDYPLYYERMFGNTFSIEIAVGVTYQNYIENVIDLGRGNSNSYYEDEKSYKLGNTFSISPKVYLEDDGFEGSYLALCYRHRYYANDVLSYQGIKLPTLMSEYKRINSFTFNYGYLFYLGKNLILDYYLGIGIATVSDSYVVSESNPNHVYYDPNSPRYFYKNENKSVTLPTGMMGLKFSYEF